MIGAPTNIAIGLSSVPGKENRSVGLLCRPQDSADVADVGSIYKTTGDNMIRCVTPTTVLIINVINTNNT